MKTKLICSLALLMFVSMLFAGADPFTAKLGNPKHEIVDSLYAVDQLSGSIYYQQNYFTVDANWQEGHTYIGDYYDWGWMVNIQCLTRGLHPSLCSVAHKGLRLFTKHTVPTIMHAWAAP